MYYVSRPQSGARSARCRGRHAPPDFVPAASHLVCLALLARTGYSPTFLSAMQLWRVSRKDTGYLNRVLLPSVLMEVRHE
jgi:hypothetical protein